MKQLYNILHNLYLKALLLPVVCLVVAGCSSGDEPDGSSDRQDPKASIGLYLSLPTMADGGKTSRTPTDGPDGVLSYDPGDGYENYIDLKGGDYRIYVFTPENRLYTAVDNDSVVIQSYSFTEFSRLYGMRFNVDKDFYERFNGKALKLVILANWHGVYPGEEVGGTPLKAIVDDGVAEADASTIADLVDCTENKAGFMEYSPLCELSHDRRIPLFGVSEFSTVDMVSGLVTWLGNIDMLRAVAKIDVYDHKDTTSKIKNVRLTRYKTILAKAPKNVTVKGDYVHGSYNPDYVNLPTVPVKNDGDGESGNVMMLDKITAEGHDEKDHFVIYVPEYRNVISEKDMTGEPRPENERAQLVVYYDDGNDFTIDFKYYNKPPENSGYQLGSHFNILRNYWYKFEIKRGISTVKPKVDVVPYGLIDLKPSFGIDSNKPQTGDDYEIEANPKS